MLKTDSTPQQTASTSNLSANPAEVAVLRPQDPIEGTTTGTGTVTDPAASDKRPPAYDDLRAFSG